MEDSERAEMELRRAELEEGGAAERSFYERHRRDGCRAAPWAATLRGSRRAAPQPDRPLTAPT